MKSIQPTVEHWLRSALPVGGQLQRTIIEQARAQGYSERTLYRAKAALGIQSQRCGYGGGGAWSWVWPKRERHCRKATIIPVKIGQKARRKQGKERGFDVAI